jgi:23S rRNA pseudouridine2457 synthase
MHDYFIIYKPYLVLSQFTTQAQQQTLANFFSVPSNVYPVGRLDSDSEGLLLLTNDATINERLLNPVFAHEREYLVQVDGDITDKEIELLQQGVDINIKGKPYRTKPCKAFLLVDSPLVASRNPPIRFRKNIPAPWIKIILIEGKNRQVRKLTAKVGFPVLRLIRTRIQELTLDNMQPGDIIQLSKKVVYKKLFNE